MTHKLLMFVENHFFLARNPKIEKTDLKPVQFRTIFLVFSVLVAAMFIISHLLHYYNYL